jgi:hypothetical protein
MSGMFMPPLETWHSVKNATIIWTDSGKFGVQFYIKDGSRVTQFFDAPEQFVESLKRAC